MNSEKRREIEQEQQDAADSRLLVACLAISAVIGLALAAAVIVLR
jgi:hypothetical protein